MNLPPALSNRALRGCPSVGAAADLLLTEVMGQAGPALLAFSPEARALSATALVGLGDATRCLRTRGERGGGLGASTSLLRLLREAGRPLVVDLLVGTVCVGTQSQRWSGLRSKTLPSVPATHLVAWPMMAPGLGLCGVLVIELQTDEHTAPLVEALQPLLSDVEALLDAVTPALLLLPEPLPPPDEGLVNLPFVGARTRHALRHLKVFNDQEDEVLLLRGESGTGKSTLARWCHERSTRHKKPFVEARLHGKPHDQQTTELFGAKRGAYTGLSVDRPGYIEAAEGGTLFIDELDKLPIETLHALLRLLDEGTYTRLGDMTVREANVRVITASNANLEQLCETGRFPRDLFERVTGFSVTLPPLRERREEIVPLARAMLRQMSAETKGAQVDLDDEACALLSGAPWTGNLRALGMTMRRAVAQTTQGVAPGAWVVLSRAQIQEALTPDAAPSTLRERLEAAAEALVDEALKRQDGPRPITFEHVERFRAVVVRAAARRMSAADVYRLFGRPSAVAQNNHQRLLREQLEAAEELLRHLSGG